MSKTTTQLIDEARIRLAELEEMQRLANVPLEPGQIRAKLSLFEEWFRLIEDRVNALERFAHHLNPVQAERLRVHAPDPEIPF